MTGPHGRAAGTMLLLLAGFAAAVGLRVLIAGPAGPHSIGAGLVFALALGVLAGAAGVRVPSRPRVARRAVLPGLGLAALFCLPAILGRLTAADGGHRPGGTYLTWAVVVAAVAVAEEALLRGALYDAALTRYGPSAASAVAAVAFAALHVPFYGWHTVGLNLAVGLCLGVLREVTGDWTAPAVAHTAADLAAWWLR
ncbi:type II CAAX prenyl endopeptidase Rce1 family protein [Krasilnikovia cinnamomea]|uniref:CPBP family glutamic-type intramembrane protease n=1 Tax=Krasilnikovia cinnamomea TaxID=349313 RepID=UPI0013EF3584|nr:CPBP family glutamic-type intramembrane protease [Krasilnikovia cinnamomea]